MLILDDATTSPEQIHSRLQREPVIQLLRQNEFIDELVRHPLLRPILTEIEQIIAANPLAAYHRTKQLPERPFASPSFRRQPSKSTALIH